MIDLTWPTTGSSLMPKKEKVAISNFYSVNEEKGDKAFFFIHGRGGNVKGLMQKYINELKNIIISNNIALFGIQSACGAWYPQPISPVNQDDAIDYIPITRDLINKYISYVNNKYNISKKNIVLCGFSAGGVMAIDIATHSEEPFGGVISHAGAILDTENLPRCKHKDVPYYVIHNRDDGCFDWYERYIPMMYAFYKNGYLVKTYTKYSGGHQVEEESINEVCNHILPNVFNIQ